MSLIIVSRPDEKLHRVIQELDYRDCARTNFLPGVHHYGVPVFVSETYGEALKEHKRLTKKRSKSL
ncbi:hypothetical protein P9J64_02980 [Deltaproteobacteria bacterium IMCC39524]|nr:hypothetical protein [Deltaproteobacteria bacterium IMCC39524]